MTSRRRSRPPRNTYTASCYASSLIYITHTIPRFFTFAQSLTSTPSLPTSWLSERSTSCWILRILRDSQVPRSGLAHYGNAGRRRGSLILLPSRDVREPYRDGLFIFDLMDRWTASSPIWSVVLRRPSSYLAANS